MQIDYYAYHSGMKHWNAGLKVFLGTGTLFLVILLDRIPVSLFVAFTMSAFTLLAGRIPWRAYLHFMTAPLAFMILGSAAIALQFTTLPLGFLQVRIFSFYVCLTAGSLGTAAEVFLKALAGMSAMYMMALSTPVNELVLVLKKLHLPKLLLELMNLIYRYIFILFEAAGQMQTAAKSRLGYRNFRRSLTSFAGIAGNLFLIALKKANAYYDALLSRGYDGSLEFLTDEFPAKKWQIALSVIYLGMLPCIRAIF